MLASAGTPPQLQVAGSVPTPYCFAQFTFMGTYLNMVAQSRNKNHPCATAAAQQSLPQLWQHCAVCIQTLLCRGHGSLHMLFAKPSGQHLNYGGNYGYYPSRFHQPLVRGVIHVLNCHRITYRLPATYLQSGAGLTAFSPSMSSCIHSMRIDLRQYYLQCASS